MLVPRVTDRGMRRRFQQQLARALDLGERVQPGTAEHHDLRTMRETLPAEFDEIGLGVAPAAERRRPLARPPEIEEAMTRLDHRAVDDARDERRCLPERHRDHRIIENRKALG